jgi:hypothetical protein
MLQFLTNGLNTKYLLRRKHGHNTYAVNQPVSATSELVKIVICGSDISKFGHPYYIPSKGTMAMRGELGNDLGEGGWERKGWFSSIRQVTSSNLKSQIRSSSWLSSVSL